MDIRKEWREALDRRCGRKLRDSFSSAAVAICGLGGLGSNIAVCLARAGVGKLILIDFDKVDIANLHRQQYKISQIGRLKCEALAENIAELSPCTQIELYNVRLNEKNVLSFLRDADIICEAFDKAEAKAMLVNEVATKMPDKFLVAASGMAGMGDANSIHTRQVSERFYLCGDEVSDADESCIFSTKVMICAAHQAHTVLKILAEAQKKRRTL